MFRIGEFSRIARVSCRLLRYYDELGLLRPARIEARRIVSVGAVALSRNHRTTKEPVVPAGCLLGTLGRGTRVRAAPRRSREPAFWRADRFANQITAPTLAFYNLKGEWDVENIGISPDIEVDYTASDVIKGRDPQLERAVQEALKLLELNPMKRMPRPASIDRVSKGRE